MYKREKIIKELKNHLVRFNITSGAKLAPKGVKLQPLKWPDKQTHTKSGMKKVPSYSI
jgi:hypothetical protein